MQSSAGKKCSAVEDYARRGACPPLGSGWGATESIAPIRYTKPILIPWSAGDLAHVNRTLQPAAGAAKLALYTAMRAQRIIKVELAGRLGVSESAVRKLTNPDHRSPFSQAHITTTLRLHRNKRQTLKIIRHHSRRPYHVGATHASPLGWGSPAPCHPRSSHR